MIIQNQIKTKSSSIYRALYFLAAYDKHLLTILEYHLTNMTEPLSFINK